MIFYTQYISLKSLNIANDITVESFCQTTAIAPSVDLFIIDDRQTPALLYRYSNKILTSIGSNFTIEDLPSLNKVDNTSAVTHPIIKNITVSGHTITVERSSVDDLIYKTLEKGTNLDTLVINGYYNTSSTDVCNSLQNVPQNIPLGELLLHVSTMGGSHQIQELWAKNATIIRKYIRQRYGSAGWKEWKTVAFTTDLKDTNTTYKFEDGTNDCFYVTPSGGTKQIVNVAETITKEINLRILPEWQDTGITGQDFATLGSGTYVVQIYDSNTANLHAAYQCFYSGIISIFVGATNCDLASEVYLHKSGHAFNYNSLFLRTIQTRGGTGHYVKLQIAADCSDSEGYASELVFKFKKIL